MPLQTATIFTEGATPQAEVVLVGRTPDLVELGIREQGTTEVTIPIPTAALPQCRDGFQEAVNYARRKYNSLQTPVEDGKIIDRPWQKTLVPSLLDGSLEIILVEPVVGTFDIRVRDTDTYAITELMAMSATRLPDFHDTFDTVVNDLEQRYGTLHDRTTHT